MKSIWQQLQKERIFLIVILHAVAALLVGPLHTLFDDRLFLYTEFRRVIMFTLVCFGTFGFAAAQVSLIAMWAAVGRGIYWLKLGVALAAVAGLLSCYWIGRWLAWLPWHRDERNKLFSEFVEIDFRYALVLALSYFLIFHVFALVACFAFRVRVIREGEPAQWEAARFQIGIKDILSLTLLIAVLLSVGRLVVVYWRDALRFDLPLEVILIATVHVFVTTPMLLYLAFHDMFRDGRFRWRMPLFLAACIVEAVSLLVCFYVFLHLSLPYDQFGFVFAFGLASIVLTGVQAFSIHVTLVPLRAVGLRLIRLPRPVRGLPSAL